MLRATACRPTTAGRSTSTLWSEPSRCALSCRANTGPLLAWGWLRAWPCSCSTRNRACPAHSPAVQGKLLSMRNTQAQAGAGSLSPLTALQTLQLEDVRHELIGNEETRGISGGQRKRVK